MLALIMANGVFSGAEIAIVSLRRTRIQQLVEDRRAGATSLAALRATPERFLATVQIGITIVGTTAAAFGGATLARHFEPLLARISWVGEHADDVALTIVVGIVSYLSLVLGELVPKSLALRAGEAYALLAAKPLLGLAWLARPFVWFLTTSSNVVLRPFSDRTTFTEARLSREELRQLVDEAAESGALDTHASELASRAIQFDQLKARDVMVPRERITAIPRTGGDDAIRHALLVEGRSRVPVYDGTLDKIVGYVAAKDVLAIAWERRLIVLQDILRPVYFVAETVTAVELLKTMKRERQRLAIVVDEHGGVTGLVTFEDLVEELVGEVFSEDEKSVELIKREPSGAALVRGDAPVREVNRELGLDLPENVEGASTMAGLCISLAGGIPHRGARLAAKDRVVLEVMETTAQSVRRVRVIPPDPQSPATG